MSPMKCSVNDSSENSLAYGIKIVKAGIINVSLSDYGDNMVVVAFSTKKKIEIKTNIPNFIITIMIVVILLSN